jgi:hypothetical protein
MGRRINTLLTGLLAIVGFNNLGTVLSSDSADQVKILNAHEGISQKTPLYLDRFTHAKENRSSNLLAWHSSHSSHESHSSHVSHSSGY